MALNDLGKYQEAIKNFDLAIKYDPNFAEAYNNKGVSYKKLGKYREAIENFDIALKYNPQYPEAYYRHIFNVFMATPRSNKKL